MWNLDANETQTRPEPQELRPHLPPFLTVTECAAHLRIHVQMLRKLIQSGDVPAFRAGRQVRISREALRRLGLYAVGRDHLKP